MFADPQPYTAHLRVGAHAWDIDSATDDPDYGPLAGVRFSWQARQDDGWPTQHDPTLLVFGVIVEAGVDFDDVDRGTWVHFTFTPDGYASPLVDFGGTVRDLIARPHARGMVYEMTAVDPLVALREEHTISAFFASGSPVSAVWGTLVQDRATHGGIGIAPAIGVDPFNGTTNPSGSGGFFGADVTIEDASAWTVLVGMLAAFTFRTGFTPLYQRGILTYRLDGSGDLDAAQPYQGTWVTASADNAPLSFVDGPDGWGAGEGNVDGCTLRTDATVWERQRIEPNRVDYDSGDLGVFTWERPHTGPDIIRYTSGGWEEGNATEPEWVLAGLDNPDQWATEVALMGAYDPDTVAGWFTLPDAMQVAVAAYDVDPRHTPNGSGRMLGMLAGATLVIPPGGRWEVRFRTRRTLPDPDDTATGGAYSADAITIDEFATAHPTVTFDDLDPALTIDDTLLIGD